MAAAPIRLSSKPPSSLTSSYLIAIPESTDRILSRDIMAANARYERAPQRDSFEDQAYTQAPPSYQATADPEPRSEGDNLPDDFKVCRYTRSDENRSDAD